MVDKQRIQQLEEDIIKLQMDVKYLKEQLHQLETIGIKRMAQDVVNSTLREEIEDALILFGVIK